MKRICGLAAVIITALSLVAGVARASTHDFFQGKVVRVIVGSSAGGDLTPTPVRLPAI